MFLIKRRVYLWGCKLVNREYGLCIYLPLPLTTGPVVFTQIRNRHLSARYFAAMSEHYCSSYTKLWWLWCDRCTKGRAAYNLHNVMWQLILPSPRVPKSVFNNHTSEDVFVCLYPINQHLLNFNFCLKTQLTHTVETAIPKVLLYSGLSKILTLPLVATCTARYTHSCHWIHRARLQLLVCTIDFPSTLWASRARPPGMLTERQVHEPDSSNPAPESRHKMKTAAFLNTTYL